MDSDHSGMNKYGSRDDSNYRVVRDRLLVIAREAQAIVNKRWESKSILADFLVRDIECL